MLARSFEGPRTIVTDIFREVDEELSRDRALAAWRRHGRYVIAFGIAAVIAVAAFGGWQDYRERQRQGEGRAYARAIDLVVRNDVSAASAAMADVAAKDGGYRVMALLEEASLKVRVGDRAGATKIYDAIAADSSFGRPFRELAGILSALVNLDSADPATLKQKLQPLAGEGHAFRPSAIELQGVMALRQGDFKAAKQYFRTLSDDASAPAGMRQRATQILTWIGERGGA
jgi:hypothetical protein